MCAIFQYLNELKIRHKSYTMKKQIYHLGLFLLLAGCTEPVSEIPTINVEIKSSPVLEEISVESLGGAVEMIPLETSDSCLLSKV